jgi:predicted TIM-barrel fold metal-dependent hydrolase
MSIMVMVVSPGAFRQLNPAAAGRQRGRHPMLIVDAQIHLWAKGTPSPHHRQEPYSAEEAIAGMDAAGVDRALIHPVMWDPDSNELAVAAVRAYPDRFAIMGWFYLDQPENRAVVARWKESPGMLGLRFYFNERHQQSWVTDGTLDWLWPAAERAGVPVALAAAMFLPTVGKIAERHPGLKLVVDHMGVPRASRGETAYRFQPELLALAKHPNIAIKATGQAGYAEGGYPFRSLHPHLRRCFDAFGPERMFWGTDITRMPCTWRQCLTLFTEELPWLKGRDLELVMGEAVCNWLGWRLPAEPRGVNG